MMYVSLPLSLSFTHYVCPTLFNAQAERHTEQFRLIGSSTENMLKELRERSAASKAAQETEVARYVWMDIQMTKERGRDEETGGEKKGRNR